MGFGYNHVVVIGRVLESRSGQYSDVLVVLDDSNEKYPNKVACEFQGDKAKATLNGLGIGDLVKVEGSVRSKDARDGDRLFTNFVAWRAERMSLPAASAPARQQHREQRPADDDIPF